MDQHLRNHKLTSAELWNKESEMMKAFLENPQKFYNQINGKEKMTSASGETMEIVCMDGRLNESGKGGSVFVRDGGSGILRDVSEGIKKIAAGYVQSAKELGVKKIRLTSHSGCGAWSLSGKDISSGEAYYEALKTEIEKQIVADAVLQGKIAVELSHITDNEHDNEGKGLYGMHNERVVYYADIPSFNHQAVEVMPAGFVISRKHFEPDYSETNAAVAIKIAFGKHGFGEKFTESEPFLLVAVADNEENLIKAAQELEEAKIEGIKNYLLNEVKDDNEKEKMLIYYSVRIKVVGILIRVD